MKKCRLHLFPILPATYQRKKKESCCNTMVLHPKKKEVWQKSFFVWNFFTVTYQFSFSLAPVSFSPGSIAKWKRNWKKERERCVLSFSLSDFFLSSLPHGKWYDSPFQAFFLLLPPPSKQTMKRGDRRIGRHCSDSLTSPPPPTSPSPCSHCQPRRRGQSRRTSSSFLPVPLLVCPHHSLSWREMVKGLFVRSFVSSPTSPRADGRGGRRRLREHPPPSLPHHRRRRANDREKEEEEEGQISLPLVSWTLPMTARAGWVELSWSFASPLPPTSHHRWRWRRRVPEILIGDDDQERLLRDPSILLFLCWR